MSNSANKYVKVFKEAVEKLEETPIGFIDKNDFAGGPRREDYEYEYTINDEAIHDLKRAAKYLKDVAKSQVNWRKYNSRLIGTNDINMDASRTAEFCIDALNEFFNAYDIEPIETSWMKFDNANPPLWRNKNKSMDKDNQ